MKIALIGSAGFVGSAIARFLHSTEHDVTEVKRANFRKSNSYYDICIDASGSSKKFLAEENPSLDIINSIANSAKVMEYYPSKLHVHISSVDVYKDLSSSKYTHEDDSGNVPSKSRYGFHKYLAEEYVKQFSNNWLIFRLSGMVGFGIKKNPIHDLITGSKFWINPESKFQYINTDNVARIILSVIDSGRTNDIYNVAGEGLIEFRSLANDYGLTINYDKPIVQERPRIVEVSIAKLSEILDLPNSRAEIDSFLKISI